MSGLDLALYSLTCWSEHEKLFARVAVGARYLLSTLESIAASERVFFMAFQKITKTRARLSGAICETYIMLNDNLVRSRRRVSAVAAG